MSQPFSPYRTWLGLPAEESAPNHYELLSLPAGEKDARKIAAAAEQAATKVRSIRPGAHAADWARILDEIQHAKLTLLDPARKAEYDRGLAARSQGSGVRSQAAPSVSELFPPGFRQATRVRGQESGVRGQESPAPPAEANKDVDVPAAIPQAAYGSYAMPTAAQPMMPQAALAVPQGVPLDPMAPVSIPGVTLPPSANPMLPAAAASPYPVAAPLNPAMPQATAYAPYSPTMSAAAAPETGEEEAEVPGVRKQSAASVLMAARKQRQLRRAALFGGTLAGLAVVGGLVGYAVWNSQKDKANSEPLVADAGNTGDGKEPATAKTSGNEGKKRLVVTPQPVPQVEDPQPRPLPAPEPAPSPEPEPMPPPTPDPAPTPTPTPQPAPVKPTRQQVIDLEAALKKSRQALGQRAFDEAQQAIAKAEPLALTADHQGKVERLRLAIQHARLFREELPKAAAKLDAAETIKVGTSTIVAIVETFPDKITVRLSGMNRTFSFDTIPQGLAVAIMDAKRVGGQPDTRTLKAMYFGTEADADEDTINEARGWLAEAAASDPNAQSLLLLFDDTYELVKEFDEEAKTASVSP